MYISWSIQIIYIFTEIVREYIYSLIIHIHCNTHTHTHTHTHTLVVYELCFQVTLVHCRCLVHPLSNSLSRYHFWSNVTLCDFKVMNDLNYLLINYIYNYLSAFIMSTPPILNELLNKCLQ